MLNSKMIRAKYLIVVKYINGMKVLFCEKSSNIYYILVINRTQKNLAI